MTGTWTSPRRHPENWVNNSGDARFAVERIGVVDLVNATLHFIISWDPNQPFSLTPIDGSVAAVDGQPPFEHGSFTGAETIGAQQKVR